MKKRGIILFIVIILIFVPVVIKGEGEPTYRALLIGNSNYLDGNPLIGPINDLQKIEDSLMNNYFGIYNQAFKKIVKKKDLTKDQMIDSIRREFSNNRENDISYIYYSGHGGFNEFSNTSYLIGVDSIGFSVHELEQELSNIPGEIILILDTCHSGGFINKGKSFQSIENYKIEENLSKDNIIKYNDSIIDIFSQKKARNYLVADKYKVLTSASKLESSYEFRYSDGWGWGGEFTRAFVTGNGYKDKFLADANYDNNVTLNEMYNFAKENVRASNVQVYPMNDSNIIGSKFELNPSKEIIVWDTFNDIPVNKTWNVVFNLELDESSLENKIYITDYNKNIFPTSISKTSDGKGVLISPQREFDYGSQYIIFIDENIISKNGSRHNSKVLALFTTEQWPADYEYLCLDTVLNGYFYSHPYPSVSQAFESFFGFPNWEYFYSTDYNHIVEFKGGALKDQVPGTVTIQFTINIEDETFKINYAAFNNAPMSNYEFDGLLDSIYNNYFNPRSNTDLESIFQEDENGVILDDKKF